jgi:hypothetical protein
LYALIPLSSGIGLLFDQIVDKDSALGAIFLLLTGGLIVGTVVSGLRAAFFDFLIVMRPKPKFNYDNLKEKNTLIAYREAIANTYRFYQFYGNMFLALSLYLAVRYVFSHVDFKAEKPWFYLNLGVWFGLGVQSNKSLRSTYRTIGQILGFEEGKPTIVSKKLPHGKVGEQYTGSLLSRDGRPPIKWSVETGTLPVGIKLDVCGGLSGNPTVQGDSTFTLRIDDALRASDTREFSLRIDA